MTWRNHSRPHQHEAARKRWPKRLSPELMVARRRAKQWAWRWRLRHPDAVIEIVGDEVRK